MKLAEILSGPERWCQNSMFNDANGMCLLAAVGVKEAKAGVFLATKGTLKRLRQAIAAVTGEPKNPIAWNDAPERTWEEVALVVDEYDRLTLLESSLTDGG